MSLINQMLQDLEKRQPEGGAPDLPSGVTSAPVAKPATRWGRIALAGVVTAVAVAGIRLLPDRAPAARVAEAPPVAQAPVVAPVAPPESVPTPAPVADTPPPVAPSAAPVAESGPTETRPASEAKPHKETRAEKKRRERREKAERQKLARDKARTEKARSAALADGGEGRRETVRSTPGRIEKSMAGNAQVDALYQQSVEAFAAGRSGESVDKLQQVLALESGHAAARQLLAKQLLEQRRLDEARNVLRDGARQHPAQLQWSTLLARLELERGDASAARQAIDAGLPQAAASADYQSLAGAVAQRQGKPDEAADFYRRALQLKPADGRAWIGLGMALEAEGHKPEAREAFRRALTTESLTPELQALAERKSR